MGSDLEVGWLNVEELCLELEKKVNFILFDFGKKIKARGLTIIFIRFEPQEHNQAINLAT